VKAGCPHPAKPTNRRVSFWELATGNWELPQNPGDRAAQRPLCPEGAHGTGCLGSPFAPLGRGVVGGVTQGSAPLHPGLSPCAALRRGRARNACLRARPLTRTPSGTPEALQPIAPGWRDRAYPGSCVWRNTHPEGGAKIPPLSCNPSRVGDLFRRFPGCASRPRATRFNASGVANTPDRAGNWRLETP
jgi:hypothetical protein